jgi:PAS domain S-box-containing protein
MQRWYFLLLPRSSRTIVWLAILIVFAICFLTLIGWMSDITLLKSIKPQLRSMHIITAICFILSATELALLQKNPSAARKFIVLQAPGAFVGLVGLLTIVIYAITITTGKEPPLGSVFFLNLFLAPETRMAFLTAILFLISGCALVLLAIGSQRTAHIAHALMLPGAMLSYMVPISYLLGVQSIHGWFNVLPALNSGLAFCALSIAIFSSRIDTWLMSVFTGNHAGSVMARQLLPAFLVIPLLVGWLRLYGERSGYFESAVGVALVVITYTACFLFLLWLSARSVNQTDNKRQTAIEELRKSEENYRILAENARDVIWIFDMNLGYIFVTPSVQQLRGYSVEETLKQTIDQVLTPESYQKARAILDREFTLEFSGQRHGPEWSLTTELEMVCKDDSTVWTEVTMNIVYSANGEPSGIMGVTRDISLRKQAEESLRKKTEEMDRFFDVNLDLLCIADTEGNFRRLNPAWERTLGHTLEELMAKKFFDFIHPDDVKGTLEAVDTLTSQHEVINFQNRYRCKDGTYRWIEWRSVPYGKLIYAAARDITDRELARESLLESEERFRLAFNTSPDAININRLEDGLYVDINEGFTALTGFTREDAIGKTSVEINIWHNDDDRRKLVQGLQAKGYYENLEAQFRRKDGSITTALMSARVIMLKGVPHIISITRDIAERKRMEEQAARQHRELQQVLDSAVAQIWYLDTEGRVVNCNRVAEKVSGITAVQARGETIHKLAPSWDDLDRRHEQSLTVARTGEPLLGSIESFRVKGEVRWVSVDKVPWRDANGTIVGVLMFIYDITSRKLAEEALEAVANEWRTTFDAVSSAIWLLDKNQRIVRANEATTAIFRKEPSEVIGHFCWEVVHGISDPPPECPVIRMQKTLRRESMELKRRESWIEVVVDPILDDSNCVQGIIHIVNDITERKRSEEQSKNLETQLLQAQKMESIGTLAGGIAHDFNNILSAIIGYTQLAMDDVSEPQKARKELKEVLKASDRAKDLVSQILTFSRKTEARYSPILLHKTVMESIKMMRSILPTTIEIRQDLIDDGVIIADPTQIHQVMLNLFTNAAHAMDKTGGVIEVRLRRVDIGEGTHSIEPELPPGHYLRLSVSDTGSGMTPEIMARIFDPYFTTKEVGRGTGLGLAVVHGIVQSHGGTITCTSTPGKETTFDIYLPEILSEEAVVRHHEEKSLPMGTERILFVDDEPILVELAKKMLSKLGYTVVTKSSSSEALELFRKDPDKFDLVITDMTMPGMTGDKLAQKFMEIRHDIPIILCSGYSEHISEEKAKKMGIREFVMKPFEMNELAKTIRKVLAGG